MEGTVEERVLDIQTEKRELVTKAFREKQKGGRRRRGRRGWRILIVVAGAGCRDGRGESS